MMWCKRCSRLAFVQIAEYSNIYKYTNESHPRTVAPSTSMRGRMSRQPPALTAVIHSSRAFRSRAIRTDDAASTIGAAKQRHSMRPHPISFRRSCRRSCRCRPRRFCRRRLSVRRFRVRCSRQSCTCDTFRFGRTTATSFDPPFGNNRRPRRRPARNTNVR